MVAGAINQGCILDVQQHHWGPWGCINAQSHLEVEAPPSVQLHSQMHAFSVLQLRNPTSALQAQHVKLIWSHA